MKNLFELVQNLKDRFLSEESKKKKIKEILLKETGFDFKPEDLEAKEDLLFLKTSSVLKSEIFINKKRILEKMREEGLFIKDIL